MHKLPEKRNAKNGDYKIKHGKKNKPEKKLKSNSTKSAGLEKSKWEVGENLDG